MRTLSSILVALVLLSASANAFAQTKKFAVGDKVELDWAGKRVTAEVTSVLANGWVRLKFDWNGRELTPTQPPDKLQPAGKTTAPAPAGNNPSTAAPAKPATTQKARTWTDKSGKFTLEARFVELKDDKVTLEKTDGTSITLGLDKLSDNDQKVAKDLAAADAENPFETKPANPFETDAKPAGSAAGSPATAIGPKLTPADWSSVEQVVTDDPGKWNVTIEAAPEVTQKQTNKYILLSKSRGPNAKPVNNPTFFDSLDALLFVASKAEAYAVVSDRRPGGPMVVRLHHCDLSAGKADEPIIFPAPIKPVDIDSSGTRLLAYPDFFYGNKGIEGPTEITVCKLGPKSVEHQLTWNINDPSNIHKTAPTMAQFVGSGHVLTLSFPGKLVLWDAANAKAIYKVDLTANSVPALSPGEKYLAAPINEGLFVLDALTGKTVGKLSSDMGWASAISFRPDGKQLAAANAQRLQVYDLSTGEMYREIYFPRALSAGKIDWAAPGYLLVDGENLVDLERRIVLWQYQLDINSKAYGDLGGVFWYGLTSTGNVDRGLFRASLPHDEAKSVAASLKAEDLLAVKPGARISLQMNLTVTPEEQQRTADALTSRLKQLGMVVADGSPLVLEASTEAGMTKEIEYRGFGGFGTQKTSVTEQISKVRIVENGKQLWETSVRTGAPFFITIKEGQTLEDALAPYQKPNVNFFSTVKIPQYLARPHENGAWGATQFTPQGTRPAAVRQPLAPPAAG